MNLISLENSGHPRSNDDLLFVQDAYREGFAAILNLLHKDSATSGIVLQGCNTSPGFGTISWGPGYIGYKGEIFRVDGGGPISNTNPTWYIIPEGAYTVDPPVDNLENYTISTPSPVLYQDQITYHNVHRIRKMAMKAGGAAGPGEILNSGLIRFENAYGTTPSDADVSLQKHIADFKLLRTRFIDTSNKVTGPTTVTNSTDVHSFIPSTGRSASKMHFHYNAELSTAGLASASDYVTITLRVNGVLKKQVKQFTGVSNNYISVSLSHVDAYVANQQVKINVDGGGSILTSNSSILICYGDTI